jgi:hypothetical protein
MPNPILRLTLAFLEKKLASMSRDDIEAMARDLRSSEKSTTEIGQAMLETIEQHLERREDDTRSPDEQ